MVGIREAFEAKKASEILDLLDNMDVSVVRGGRRYALAGHDGDLSLKEITELVSQKVSLGVFDDIGKNKLAAANKIAIFRRICSIY